MMVLYCARFAVLTRSLLDFEATRWTEIPTRGWGCRIESTAAVYFFELRIDACLLTRER